MRKIEPDWVVADAVKQELRCDRCKGAVPISNILGKSLSAAAGFMRAFVKLHKECPP